ncbi:hypothetical protein Aph02nite_75380 [Actinoplanes philippinensis]|nr:hypothetical protein Aph02nite_75380 [Actinoplanes philippinensis]
MLRVGGGEDRPGRVPVAFAQHETETFSVGVAEEVAETGRFLSGFAEWPHGRSVARRVIDFSLPTAVGTVRSGPGAGRGLTGDHMVT